VATIALAVGATTAIFGVVDNILLRPLPFQESERVVALCETNAATGSWCGASPMNVADWARSSSTLESAGVARTESFIAQGDSGSYGGMGGIVTPGFFEVLRVRPTLAPDRGRDLPRGSNHRRREPRVLAAATGQRPSIVGRSIVLNRYHDRRRAAGRRGCRILSRRQVTKPLTASSRCRGPRLARLHGSGRWRPRVSDTLLRADRHHITAAGAYPEANADWGLRLSTCARRPLVTSARRCGYSSNGRVVS
jgi:hypothetical protein